MQSRLMVGLLALFAPMLGYGYDTSCAKSAGELQSAAAKYEIVMQIAKRQKDIYESACRRVYGKYTYTEQACGKGGHEKRAYENTLSDVARQEEHLLRAIETVHHTCDL